MAGAGGHPRGHPAAALADRLRGPLARPELGEAAGHAPYLAGERSALRRRGRRARRVGRKAQPGGAQGVDAAPVGGVGELRDDRRGGLLADPLDGGERFGVALLGGLHQAVDVVVAGVDQQLGCLGADFRHAQRRQHRAEGPLPAAFDPLLQQRHLAGSEPVPFQQGVHVEDEYVVHVRQHPGVDQLVEGFRSEMVDVHLPARGEEADAPAHLRAAALVAAEVMRPAQLQRGAAFRTALRQAPGGVALLVLVQHPLHRRNHVPPLRHRHPIADRELQGIDVVLVVQRDVGHGGAGDRHRRDARDRRDASGAPHLDVDLPYLGLPLRRVELERQGPARVMSGYPQVSARRQLVDLDHQAVDLVVERRAPLAGGLQHLRQRRRRRRVPRRMARLRLFQQLRRRQQPVAAVDRKAQRPQPVHRRGVVGRRIAGKRALVGHQPQRNGRHVAALYAPHRAGGEVARVGVGRLGGGVEVLEFGPRQKDLAAHGNLDRLRQLQRHAADRAYVGRDVVAHHAVAAGHGARQPALLVVVQDDGGAVDLLLHDVAQRPPGRGVGLRHPRTHLRRGVGLVEAQHRHRMGRLRQLRAEVGADPGARRVGPAQLRVVSLQPQQLVEQAIVFRVLHRRPRQDVILVIAAMQQGGQLGVARLPGSAHGAPLMGTPSV